MTCVWVTLVWTHALFHSKIHEESVSICNLQSQGRWHQSLLFQTRVKYREQICSHPWCQVFIRNSHNQETRQKRYNSRTWWVRVFLTRSQTWWIKRLTPSCIVTRPKYLGFQLKISWTVQSSLVQRDQRSKCKDKALSGPWFALQIIDLRGMIKKREITFELNII